jgi:hypothetical protein
VSRTLDRHSLTCRIQEAQHLADVGVQVFSTAEPLQEVPRALLLLTIGGAQAGEQLGEDLVLVLVS